jgi:hypothetical protein
MLHFSNSNLQIYWAILNYFGENKLMCFRNMYKYKYEITWKKHGTHKVYIEMFDMCSISYSVNVDAIFEFSSRTAHLWLTDVGYGLWNSLSKLSEGLSHRKLVYLVFNRSPQVEVALIKVRRSRGPRNCSCSSYPSLLYLWRHFPLVVIGAPVAADVLQSVLTTKT